MTNSSSPERTRLLEDDHEEQGPSLHEGRTNHSLGKPTSLPWRPLFVLFVLNGMQPLAFEIVFPFVNQMIVEIGIVNDPKRVGFYSGLIESIFSCMSFIAILPCSYLADTIGRKPVILGGMVGMGISVACFGMSKSLLAMILSRCLGGALGGSWATMRVMLGEMTDKSNQGTAFSGLSISHRLGQVIGLPLGGLLAHPERNFPVFRSTFWYENPFALPCFVASAIVFVTVAWGCVALEETLTWKKKEKVHKPTSTYGTMASPADTSVTPSTPGTAPSPGDFPPEGMAINRISFKSILTPSIISIMCSNIVMCLISESLFALFPLFAFTPISSGGLGMSEAAIGIQMGIRAMLHVVVMVFFGPLQRRMGAVRLYQVVMWTWPLTVICFPILSYIARWSDESISTWQLNLGLFIFFFIWACNGFSWPIIGIIVNDAAPSVDALSRLNGVSQMAIVLPQAIAPACSTSLFALSIKSGIAGGKLIWVILFILTCAAAAHSMTLHEPNSNWRVEVQKSRNPRC